MASRTVALPASSPALIEMRFASGAIRRSRPATGGAASRRVPSPAMMPATWVPCPYVSATVVAAAFVTTDATTRDAPSAPAKSGRSPAIPVSITATPTPLPVVVFHAAGAKTEVGYDEARRLGSGAGAAGSTVAGG